MLTLNTSLVNAPATAEAGGISSLLPSPAQKALALRSAKVSARRRTGAVAAGTPRTQAQTEADGSTAPSPAPSRSPSPMRNAHRVASGRGAAAAAAAGASGAGATAVGGADSVAALRVVGRGVGPKPQLKRALFKQQATQATDENISSAAAIAATPVILHTPRHQPQQQQSEETESGENAAQPSSSPVVAKAVSAATASAAPASTRRWKFGERKVTISEAPPTAIAPIPSIVAGGAELPADLARALRMSPSSSSVNISMSPVASVAPAPSPSATPVNSSNIVAHHQRSTISSALKTGAAVAVLRSRFDDAAAAEAAAPPQQQLLKESGPGRWLVRQSHTARLEADKKLLQDQLAEALRCIEKMEAKMVEVACKRSRASLAAAASSASAAAAALDRDAKRLQEEEDAAAAALGEEFQVMRKRAASARASIAQIVREESELANLSAIEAADEDNTRITDVADAELAALRAHDASMADMRALAFASPETGARSQQLWSSGMKLLERAHIDLHDISLNDSASSSSAAAFNNSNGWIADEQSMMAASLPERNVDAAGQVTSAAAARSLRAASMSPVRSAAAAGTAVKKAPRRWSSLPVTPATRSNIVQLISAGCHMHSFAMHSPAAQALNLSTSFSGQGLQGDATATSAAAAPSLLEGSGTTPAQLLCTFPLAGGPARARLAPTLVLPTRAPRTQQQQQQFVAPRAASTIIKAPAPIAPIITTLIPAAAVASAAVQSAVSEVDANSAAAAESQALVVSNAPTPTSTPPVVEDPLELESLKLRASVQRTIAHRKAQKEMRLQQQQKQAAAQQQQLEQQRAQKPSSSQQEEAPSSRWTYAWGQYMCAIQ